MTNTIPLFPGYMFVGIKPDGAPWQKINSTLGVSRLIATVETIDSNRRIWVLIDIMGQITRVQVASEKVKHLN